MVPVINIEFYVWKKEQLFYIWLLPKIMKTIIAGDYFFFLVMKGMFCWIPGWTGHKYYRRNCINNLENRSCSELNELHVIVVKFMLDTYNLYTFLVPFGFLFVRIRKGIHIQNEYMLLAHLMKWNKTEHERIANVNKTTT